MGLEEARSQGSDDLNFFVFPKLGHDNVEHDNNDLVDGPPVKGTRTLDYVNSKCNLTVLEPCDFVMLKIQRQEEKPCRKRST